MYHLTCKKMNLVSELSDVLSNLKKPMKQTPALEKLISTANSIREDLGFETEQKFQHQKPSVTIKQEKIEQYLRILLNLNMHVDIPKKWSVPFQFRWNGKISSSASTNANFYYEIACMFYNYGVLYLNQGMALLKDPDQTKTGLKFFRSAMWGFQQAERAAHRAIVSGNVVPELTGLNVKAAQALAASFAYRALFLCLRDKFPSFTLEQRTSFHKNAYQECFKAAGMLEKVDGYQFLEAGALRKTINFYKLIHICSILMEKATEYEQLHAEAPNKGHIGVQIAFLENLKEFRGELKDLASALKDPEATELATQVEKALAKLPDLLLENKEVYKAPVPKKEALPPIPESEYKINPTESASVKTLIEDMPADLKSSAYSELDSNLDLLLAKYKAELNAAIELMSQQKIETYKKHNVDVLVRLGGVSSDSIEDKVKEIRDVFGGYTGYLRQLEALSAALAFNDQGTRKMVSMIEKDALEDENFYRTYGIRVMGLKDPHNPFMKNFERHGVALTALKNRQGDTQKRFGEYTELLKKIDQGSFSKEIAQVKTTISSSEELQAVAKKANALDEMLKVHFEPEKNALLDYLKSATTRKMVTDVFFLSQNSEDIYKILGDEMQEKVDEFAQKTEQIKKVVEKIGSLAATVNEKLSKETNITYQQKAFTDVNNLLLFYHSIMADMENHENIKRNGEVLNQLLEDYIISKNMQKQEILKNIQAFKNVGQFFERIIDTEFHNPYFRK